MKEMKPKKDKGCRLCEKTHFMFACDEEDLRYIEKLLTDAGYNVKGEKDLLDKS